ncbi:uncharacterized protein CTRU02_202688 [Colletotrichum truncatum]|uniref:Integral membrane protein n=1 Tax=Colletotrichum truncatum TaxID=5467 RepID=A0ACC3ZKX7_COLTU|nr:uncharacterized protein CTRU02_10611 [Colletotrichum truncatum]KAF6786912.1 integral membrane protein [Colletotrichum truncatum]
MASRVIFDPLVALRAAPLVSSTCTLLFAWDQNLFLGMLNAPNTRKKSTPVLQSYFQTFFPRGLTMVLGFIAVSATTAVANLRLNPNLLRAKGTFWWYAAGASLSLGHLVYVPFVAPKLQALMEAKEDTDLNDTLDSWLSLNWQRLLTTDLGAWIAFGIAVTGTLRTA